MSAPQTPSPFELLLDLDRRSRAQATGLPVPDEVREQWPGVAVQIRAQTLLVPMTNVGEVVSPPSIAPVPGVKPWVLGIANMRGTLLPIMDLQGLLYGQSVLAEVRGQRIVVVNHRGVSAGLQVDAVLGIKHVWVDAQAEELPPLDAELSPYVEDAFHHGSACYAVFSVPKLVESDLFMDVAL